MGSKKIFLRALCGNRHILIFLLLRKKCPLAPPMVGCCLGPKIQCQFQIHPTKTQGQITPIAPGSTKLSAERYLQRYQNALKLLSGWLGAAPEKRPGDQTLGRLQMPGLLPATRTRASAMLLDLFCCRHFARYTSFLVCNSTT